MVVGTELGSVFGNLDLQGSKSHAVNAAMIGDGSGAVVLRGFNPDEEIWGIQVSTTTLAITDSSRFCIQNSTQLAWESHQVCIYQVEVLCIPVVLLCCPRDCNGLYTITKQC